MMLLLEVGLLLLLVAAAASPGSATAAAAACTATPVDAMHKVLAGGGKAPPVALTSPVAASRGELIVSNFCHSPSVPEL
jgi:hypothetical protein